MFRHSYKYALSLTVLLAFGGSGVVSAQERQDSAALIAAQRAALAKLTKMDGVWRGPVWTLLPSGEKREITQTERIGPFLDGSVNVIEGRGYDAQGKTSFNALGIISYNTVSSV